MELITTDAAAKEIGITVRQLRNHIQAGKLKATRHGRFWLVTRSDFERFRTWYEQNPPRPGPKRK